MNTKWFLLVTFILKCVPQLLARLKGLVCIGGLCIAAIRVEAVPLPSWLNTTLLWAGSYREDEDILNRAEAKLRLDFKDVSPWLDFTLRTQFFDKRPWDDAASGGASFFNTGVYHNPTGSRILYGPLDIGGLPARIRNIYRHGTPFVSTHSGHTVDLKTDPGATPKNTLSTRLVTPSLSGWQVATAFTAEEENDRNGFLIGMNTVANKRIQAAAEFYYQDTTLPVQKATAWFSDKPPLPERETRIYAGTARFLSPLVSIAGDLAYSETFAFGRGMYGNLGLQFGNRPWRFSLATDTVTVRYVDSAGAVPGEGLRIGGKIEHFRPRGELWRIETTLRSYGANTFTRSSTTLYYHFPAMKNTVSLSQISLRATRNSTDNAKILDTWHFNIGITRGRLRTKTSFTLDEYTNDDTPSPFPDRECNYVVYGWKIDEEVAVSLDFLTLTTTLDYLKKLDTATAEWKDAKISFSLSAQFHKVPGRVTVKAAYADDDWQLVVSWRFSLSL